MNGVAYGLIVVYNICIHMFDTTCRSHPATAVGRSVVRLPQPRRRSTRVVHIAKHSGNRRVSPSFRTDATAYAVYIITRTRRAATIVFPNTGSSSWCIVNGHDLSGERDAATKGLARAEDDADERLRVSFGRFPAVLACA